RPTPRDAVLGDAAGVLFLGWRFVLALVGFFLLGALALGFFLSTRLFAFAAFETVVWFSGHNTPFGGDACKIERPAARRAFPDPGGGSVGECQLLGRLLAVPSRLQLIIHPLSLAQGGQARPLDRGNMNEGFGPAVIRRNESEAFCRVEPFTGSCRHR